VAGGAIAGHATLASASRLAASRFATRVLVSHAVVAECLSEDGLLAFFEGRATTQERDRIERHLCDCASCRRVVAAFGPTSPRGAPEQEPRAEDVIDGQYRVARVIGRGGMGAVFLAYDLRLDRNVALKFCANDAAATALRVEREAIALARLAHPNVVVVHQVGEWRGEVYIAMEYVTGGNAREWLQVRRPGWREIVALYAAAGEGLAAAHQAGFVHRDFKPDNVLVGSDDRPRVADFGLVGADAGVPRTEAADASRARLTRTDAILGTLGYMAPEQLRGGDVDARADQFAFCVALWEALYGARPFAGATPAELGAAIATGPRRSTRGRGPRRIEAALRRGLAADRERRWPSMQALVAELRRERRVSRLMIAGAGAGVALAAVAVVAASRADSDAAGPPCTALPGDASDIYVDAAGVGSGTGTSACPYPTITRALEVSRPKRTIHVAAGSYDAARGERFPLIVRGDTRIVGAGADTTRVTGTGAFDPRGTGIGNGPAPATFVVGDDRAPVELSGLALVGGADRDGFGVICDRGNLGALGRTTTQPPPSFAATDVDVSGYEVGILATVTIGGNGCNARLVRAIVHDAGMGVWVLGCGAAEEPTPRRTAAALDIEASSVRAIRYPDKDPRTGRGIVAWDCTRWLAVRDTDVGRGDIGLEAVNHDAATTTMTLERDTFHDLRVAGVLIGRAAAIDRLVGNTFGNNTAKAPASIAERGVGLLLDGGNEEKAYPAVRLARDNAFFDNDVAIELRGRWPVLGTIDFGRVDDPGRNSIRCNATLDGSSVPGHDLVVRAPIAASARITFAGDRWDHAPPSAGSANGDDIDAAPADRAAIDTSAAVAGREACSSRPP
jgi:hypothetical protein